jgi:hypothetical protein
MALAPRTAQNTSGCLGRLAINRLAAGFFASLGPANTFQPQRYGDPEKHFSAGFEADFQD